MSSANLTEWIEEYSTEGTFNLHTAINNFLNIMVPVCLWSLFHFTLLQMAISFVLFDIVLVFANYFFCYFLPYQKTKRLSLDGVQKRIDKMHRRIEYLEKEKDICDYYSEEYHRCTREISKLSDFIEIEEDYLAKEQKKIEKENVEKDARNSKDFENKQEYFLRCSEKLRYYVQEQNINVLQPVLSSVLKLKNTLNNKPSAIDIVPNTLYIYLDEILNVANSLMSLDNEHRQKYMENIEKVSVGIQATIVNLIERINRLETNEIEVSLNVLMQELGEELCQSKTTNDTITVSYDDIIVTKNNKSNKKHRKGDNKKNV